MSTLRHLWKVACPLVLACLLAAQTQQQAAPAPQQGSPPISIGLLLDDSGSMQRNHGLIAAAVRNLVLESNPQDQFFVVHFGDHPYIDQDFTTDRNLILQALQKPTVGGGTAFYDAVIASAEHVKYFGKYERRALIVLSDGDDNASHISTSLLLHRLQQLTSAPIYCIAIPADRDRPRARLIMEQVSQQTGGVASFPKKIKELNNVMAQLAQQLRTKI